MKRIICCVVFFLLVVLLITSLNNILIPKSINRYYMFDKHLAELDQNFDVQVFGSCHAYTSFNPTELCETHNISTYVLGNAGEFIPTTFVRMSEQFKKHIPKVVLVEVWGLYCYETYSPHENVLGTYIESNVECLPISKEKFELIEDYKALDKLYHNFPISKYKERIIESSLTDVDFQYSFEGTRPYSTDYVYNEMSLRFDNYGFKPYPSNVVADYHKQQAKIANGETQQIESDIMKYVEKIIDLCDKNGVELIFYRSPYRSRASELKKTNFFSEYCLEKNIPFYDLEQCLDLDCNTDFYDYEHLSETGAAKATAFLNERILQKINK